MRGLDSQTEALFAYVTPESFVPKIIPCELYEDG